jgi:hypothetical protein
MHKADPFGDEHYGAWFLYTKGSAVWYRIGRYITFDEHADAYNHFGANSNEDMCKAAAKADFDSVIFLKHVVRCVAGRVHRFILVDSLPILSVHSIPLFHFIRSITFYLDTPHTVSRIIPTTLATALDDTRT